MAYGGLLMIIGSLLITVGWITLYFFIKKRALVTEGIYAYSRHPQYIGFILIILGWFIGWPTHLTLILTPILVYKYVKVCIVEDKEITNIGGYQDYKNSVPSFI
ncbi:methyltransferase family protein [Nanoarchaeota archaeon]